MHPVHLNGDAAPLSNGVISAINPNVARGNGLVKFNRNVEKDIFGYYCLSFLNEDGDINEKKVRHDFGKFGEVVSVRGALGKQKGHVFVRFRKKEAAENCLNCLNSFPLSEMSELFGKYLFLSPATPRDIDCDMYGMYSISFLNLNSKSFREIRSEFSKFGEIVRLTSGGGGNTDELVSISYSDKNAAVKALQTHFTNKEFPYLDIAKGSSLLLVNSSDSSDNEDYESEFPRSSRVAPIGPPPPLNVAPGAPVHHSRHTTSSPGRSSSNRHHPDDPFHDPNPMGGCSNGHLGLGGGSDVVDELLKPFQSYFNIYRTGQYHAPLGDTLGGLTPSPNNPPVPGMNEQGNSYGLGQNTGNLGGNSGSHIQRSPEKKYRIKSVKMTSGNNGVVNPLQQQHSPQSSSSSKSNSPFVPNNVPLESLVKNQIQASSPAIKPQLIPTNSEKPLINALKSNSAISNPTIANNSFNEPLLQALKPNVQLPRSHANGGSEIEAAPQNIHHTGNILGGGIQGKNSNKMFEKEGTPSSVTSTSSKLSVASSNSSCITGYSQGTENETADVSMSTENDEVSTPVSETHLVVNVEKDMFGLYSLTMICKSKDLSERKVKADFEKHGCESAEGESVVATIRGQFNLGETLTISFYNKEAAESCCKSPALLSKYPTLSPAPMTKIVQDKDGYFSVEFSNSGMSGIREITKEFSKYGEVVKVMSSGAKSNAVKRVTVSYAEEQSAFDAVASYSGSKRKNKDFQNVDFAKECILEVKTSSHTGVDLPIQEIPHMDKEVCEGSSKDNKSTA